MNTRPDTLNKILEHRQYLKEVMIEMTDGQTSVMKHLYLRELSVKEMNLINLLKTNSSCFYSGWTLPFFLSGKIPSNKIIRSHVRPIDSFDLDVPAGIISHPLNTVYMSPNVDHFYDTYNYKWKFEDYNTLLPLGQIFWHKINIEIRLKLLSYNITYNDLGGNVFEPPENHLVEIEESKNIINDIVSKNNDVKELLPMLDDKTTMLNSEYLGTTQSDWIYKYVSDKLLISWRNQLLNERWVNPDKTKTNNQGSYTPCRPGYRYEFAAAEAVYECLICGLDHGLKCCHEYGYDKFKPNTPLGIINSIENVSLLCPNHDKELEIGDDDFIKLFKEKKELSLKYNPPKRISTKHDFWDCGGGVCTDYDFKKGLKEFLK